MLLLVFLPLQSSWAAAATYCEHESSTQAPHIGHHEHEHHGAVADASDDESAAMFDADCDHCHGHFSAALSLPMAVPTFTGVGQSTPWTEVGSPAPVVSPPERPQWAGHA